MEIVFIWFGLYEPLSDYRIACIKRAKEVYPDAKFKCITNFTKFYDMEVVDATALAKEMTKLGYYGNTDKEKYMYLSDEMRFWWLTHYPNTLYLDTDTWCEKPMPITPRAGKVRIEALWSGEQCERFMDILVQREKGKLFIGYHRKVDAEDLSEYFTHKKTILEAIEPLMEKQL